ncbi:MAG: hypothetical protein ACREOJ_10315, partial [Gemmatimonadaceae bacterium]
MRGLLHQGRDIVLHERRQPMEVRPGYGGSELRCRKRREEVVQLGEGESAVGVIAQCRNDRNEPVCAARERAREHVGGHVLSRHRGPARSMVHQWRQGSMDQWGQSRLKINR